MPNGAAEGSSPDTPDVLSERPRFRIQQLLVLTAVMAIMLAATGSREFRGLEISPLVQLAFTASGILYSLLGSVAITVVGYGIWWHRQRRFSFDEPGYWLLVAIAAHQVLILLQVLLIVTLATIQGIGRGDSR